MFYQLIIPIIFVVTSFSAAWAQPMRFFTAHNGGNCYDTCSWIAAEGEITAQTPEAFEAFIENGLPASILYLDSPGGNVVAALRLGRRFRELGLSTAVGRTQDASATASATFVGQGRCESACSYVLLGGVSRSLTGFGFSAYSTEEVENAEMRILGFHGISVDTESLNDLLTAEILSSDQGIDAVSSSVFGAAEYTSGLIVEYLTEMGADARILQLAIGDVEPNGRLTMKYPSTVELEDLGILSSPNADFETFKLQIVGNGLVATSQRTNAGLNQSGMNFLRLFKPCDAPTPWLAYSIGSGKNSPSDLPTVMPAPDHVEFYFRVRDADAAGRDDAVYPTINFSRINNHDQIYTKYVYALGGETNKFGDLSVPSFASPNGLTVFLPLTPDWRTIIGSKHRLDWSFDPRVAGVPTLVYSFSDDDLTIADHVAKQCLTVDEIAAIRF